MSSSYSCETARRPSIKFCLTGRSLRADEIANTLKILNVITARGVGVVSLGLSSVLRFTKWAVLIWYGVCEDRIERAGDRGWVMSPLTDTHCAWNVFTLIFKNAYDHSKMELNSRLIAAWCFMMTWTWKTAPWGSREMEVAELWAWLQVWASSFRCFNSSRANVVTTSRWRAVNYLKNMMEIA